ncbi:phage tail assembly protein [Halodesulfovibrio aestuarii]|uniref:Phage tail assembly protein n=1 Tax=Halodesulfovibrio aestuarii TaxID=126333 RepID=A0ABV4JTC8_9BACT
MRTKQIELKYPVTVDGHEYDVITMRSPKVRDQLIAQKTGGKEEMELTLFANLCEIPVAVLEELEIADYNQFHTAYQDFLS